MEKWLLAWNATDAYSQTTNKKKEKVGQNKFQLHAKTFPNDKKEEHQA